MTHPQSLTLALMGSLVLACEQPRAAAESSPPSDTAADRAAIDRVREREVTALSGGVPDSVATVYASDIVIMPPNEPTVTGIDNVRNWFKATTDQFNVAGKYSNANVTLAGDWAFEQYVGELTLTPKKGGKPTVEQFKGMHIYRRQPDGSWRITHDVFNSPAPAAATKP